MNYKEKRKQKGKTQSDVAMAASISLTAYQLIERGVTRDPKPATIEAIEAYLKKD